VQVEPIAWEVKIFNIILKTNNKAKQENVLRTKANFLMKPVI
jgi:hypothetical protein